MNSETPNAQPDGSQPTDQTPQQPSAPVNDLTATPSGSGQIHKPEELRGLGRVLILQDVGTIIVGMTLQEALNERNFQKAEEILHDMLRMRKANIDLFCQHFCFDPDELFEYFGSMLADQSQEPSTDVRPPTTST